MDELFITEMQKKLEKSLEEVKEEILTLTESSRPVAPDNSLGRLTRMDAIGQKSINEAALKNTELKLQRIESALKRINNDEYGECILCGDEIGKKRLKAIPEIPTCLDCSS